ncbi:hypothetical protein F5Y07DRAFT_389601 [Xylaria sp. FL0933]|nr:hypothetical protein F5Y07DRAFT_389601 [Xylaria sp. FL0933]
MAYPSSALSPTMKSMLSAKVREVDMQRDICKSQRQMGLSTRVQDPDDARQRISDLLIEVKLLCGPELSRDPTCQAIERWLQRSTNVASSSQPRQYEAFLKWKLEIQSRKFDMASIWCRVMSEWMNSPTLIDGAPGSISNEPNDMKNQAAKFDISPHVPQRGSIEQYMQSIFSSKEANQAFNWLAQRIQIYESELFASLQSGPFNKVVVRHCINGLLAKGLLSDNKQATLREFLIEREAVDELTEMLNIQFLDFINCNGHPTTGDQNGEPRLQKVEAAMANIFVYYINMGLCVELKNAVPVFWAHNTSGIRDWKRGDFITIANSVRYEYFTGTRRDQSQTVDDTRAAAYHNYFSSPQLLSSEIKPWKHKLYADGVSAEADENWVADAIKKQKDANRKGLLHTIATEVIVHRDLYGEVAVVRSAFRWRSSGTPHKIIPYVMLSLGFSSKMASFFSRAPYLTYSNEGSESGALRTGGTSVRPRGMARTYASGNFIDEMILFLLSFAVKETTGMLLYRNDSDLFLCGKPERCAKAWRVMKQFTDFMGIEIITEETGSVHMKPPDKTTDMKTQEALPEGLVRIGHLLLHQETGEWDFDERQIDIEIDDIQNELSACCNILDWVNTWNSWIGRLSSPGGPAYCLGLRHAESVLKIYRRVYEYIFYESRADVPRFIDPISPGSPIALFLMGWLEEKLGLLNLPEFVLLKYDADRDAFKKLTPKAREARLKSLYSRFDTEVLRRITILVHHGSPPISYSDEFLSFEEYTSRRESTSVLLNKAYNKLLIAPIHEGGVKLDPSVPNIFSSYAERVQHACISQQYARELEEFLGGSRGVDEKYLPLRFLNIMKPDNVSATTNPISSHRSSNQQAAPTNPFKLIPPAYRPLLTTLHVLYPSTLLPALDLLDRRLVTRVILEGDTTLQSGHVQTEHGLNNDLDEEISAGGANSNNTLEEKEDGRPKALYHLVRSAQPQSHRRQHSTSTGGQVYVVRLESWNCTCAAFAFSAFPPLSSPTSSSLFGQAVSGFQIFPAAAATDEDTKLVDAGMASARENAGQTWEFGGLSADGRDGAGGVACCKHLLACVLAERWDAVLGRYIEERLVGREEAAGLVGDL